MSHLLTIADNYIRLREEIPPQISIVLAAKRKSAEEVKAVIDAGAVHISENYVQEAQNIKLTLGKIADKVTWHMTGHLQTNKIKKSLALFDMIQTVDSLEKAEAINKRMQGLGNERLSVLLEINIANEDAKRGIRPDAHSAFESYLAQLAGNISSLPHIELKGLMTMGPWVDDPEELRPFFRKTKTFFDSLQSLPNVSLDCLSMGMTNSYHVAIEEGATMVRIGTKVFGERS